MLGVAMHTHEKAWHGMSMARQGKYVHTRQDEAMPEEGNKRQGKKAKVGLARQGKLGKI